MRRVVRPKIRMHRLLQRSFYVRSVAFTGLFLLAIFYTIYFLRSLLLPIVLALLLSYLLRPIVRGIAKLKIPPIIGAVLGPALVGRPGRLRRLHFGCSSGRLARESALQRA